MHHQQTLKQDHRVRLIFHSSLYTNHIAKELSLFKPRLKQVFMRKKQNDSGSILPKRKKKIQA